MAAVSLYDRLAPPEPEFSDEEWDRAYEFLVQERVDLGWPRADAEAHVDDLMVSDQCVQAREDQKTVWADEERARRKENW